MTTLPNGAIECVTTMIGRNDTDDAASKVRPHTLLLCLGAQRWATDVFRTFEIFAFEGVFGQSQVMGAGFSHNLDAP